MPSPTMGARNETIAAISARVAGCDKILPTVLADRQAGGKIGQDRQAEHHIDPFNGRRTLHEGGDNDEHDGGDIEDQQAVTEAVRLRAVALVEFAKSVDYTHGAASRVWIRAAENAFINPALRWMQCSRIRTIYITRW